MTVEHDTANTQGPYGPYHLDMRPERVAQYLNEAHRQRAVCAAQILSGIGNGIGRAAHGLAGLVTHAGHAVARSLSGHHGATAHR